MNHLRVLTCSFIFFPFRFDPDKEIESLEKQEEEEKKKHGEGEEVANEEEIEGSDRKSSTLPR